MIVGGHSFFTKRFILSRSATCCDVGRVPMDSPSEATCRKTTGAPRSGPPETENLPGSLAGSLAVSGGGAWTLAAPSL